MTGIKISGLKMVKNFHACCKLALKINGKRTSGVIFYDREVIIIHYKGTRQLCLNEYNMFNGDLSEFLAQHIDKAPMFKGFTNPNISPEQLDFLGD